MSDGAGLDPTLQARVADVFERQAATVAHLRRSTAGERIAKLQRLRTAFLARSEAIREAARLDMGKPAFEVDLTEILGVLQELRDAIRHTRRWMKPQRVGPTALMLGTRAWIRYEPKGRCLIISPWNYPVYLTLVPLVSAIAAGNTAILKPSEMTPRLSAVLAGIIREVFPEEEVALFEGDAALSTQLLSLPFDHIFFTGSPAIGKVVMGAAAQSLASCTLELGGKSPTVIDASADLHLAAQTLLWAKFLNLGQSCLAPDHIYVHESVHGEFLRECRAQLEKCYGENPALNPDLARIVNRRHSQRLAGMLREAVAGGAQVLAGGEVRESEHYLAPTLIDRPPPDSRLMQEEIFGPLLPVLPYRTLDEVVADILRRPKPLALYIWSRDATTIERLLADVSSGGACVNHAFLHGAHGKLPFGGVNHSGIGSSHGRYGFLDFSHQRAVLQSRFMLARLLFPPYRPWLGRLLQRLHHWL